MVVNNQMDKNEPFLNLKERKCVPCEGNKSALLNSARIAPLHEELNKWNIIDDKRLEKVLQFKDFASALAFVNSVGKIAETEGHHPDINIFSWNKVKLILFTHSIDGLSENDFILAAKIDELAR